MTLQEMYRLFPKEHRDTVKVNVESSPIYIERKLKPSNDVEDYVKNRLGLKHTEGDLKDPKRFLNYAFNWTSSPQGATHWLAVYRQIEKEQEEAAKKRIDAKVKR